MMKTIVILATLTLTASLVHAQPAVTEVAPAPAPAHSDGSYLGLAMTAGADDVGLYGGWVVDGGLRVHDGVWAHVGLTLGGMSGVDEPTYGSHFTRVQAGLEGRRCVLDGAVCGVLGADLAYRDEQLMAEYDHGSLRGAGAIGRLGADVGSKHLRFRPALEGMVDSHGPGGVGIVAGLAYQW